jgi:hypothetical protein
LILSKKYLPCKVAMKYLSLFLSLLLVYSNYIYAQHNVNEFQFKQLDFRFIGPDGNRTIAVRGEPGNNLVMYVGMASGGLFKTEDGGGTWHSVFDDQDISSVSALALAPSNPSHIWVGTGETFLIRPAHAMGNGIYKSTDAGKTFEHKGLKETARIGQIEVDPRNPDVVYAAQAWDIPTALRKIGECIKQLTGEKPGKMCFLWTRAQELWTWP